MELKRILARDSRSANEKAIQLYGPEVLIISSQRVDQQTELIVAVDVSGQDHSVPPAEAAAAKVKDKSEVFTSLTDQPQEAPNPELDFVPFSQIFQNAQSFAPLCSDDKPDKPIVSGLMTAQDSMPKATSATLQPFSPAANHLQPSAHEVQRNHEIVDMLRQEMAALRKEFDLTRQMMPWQNGLVLAPDIQKLVEAMAELGLPVSLRALLTDSVRLMTQIDQAWPELEALLAAALARPKIDKPEAGIHALCGPSGAGKTSMVARLALSAANAQGVDSQIMISFADPRPGAWTQIQLLAAQAGVRCFRAADVEVVNALLDEHSGKNIWIDTCGADFGTQAEVLHRAFPQLKLHAVLPVDATVTSVQKILQHPPAFWSTLMLTKTDEAAHPWPLIKGLSESPLPVSCVSSANCISQAPQAFALQSLVKMALRPLQDLFYRDQAALDVPVSCLTPPARRTRVRQPTEASTPVTARKRVSKKTVSAPHAELHAKVEGISRRTPKVPVSLKAVNG